MTEAFTVHLCCFMTVFTVISLQYIQPLDAACPNGKLVKLFHHSNTIRARTGYRRNDECQWKIYAPKDKENYRVVVNITRITCSKNLIIEGEDFCQRKPRTLRTYIPNTCATNCIRNNCRKIANYPLTINYGRYADDDGFTLRYSFRPCIITTTTRRTRPRRLTTTQASTTKRNKETTLKASSKQPSGNISTTSLSDDHTQSSVTVIEQQTSSSFVRIANISDSNHISTTTKGIPRATSSQNELQTGSAIPTGTQISLVAIILPIVAVVLVLLLLTIVVLKIRHMKRRAVDIKNQEDSSGTIQSYVTTENAAIYETVDNQNEKPQSYGNQPSEENMNTKKNDDSDENHIYEHITSENEVTPKPKIEPQYDDISNDFVDSFDDDSSEGENDL